MVDLLVGGIIVIGAALVLLYITYFNRLRTLGNGSEEAWAQIDVEL
jgi:hypothetical protein